MKPKHLLAVPLCSLLLLGAAPMQANLPALTSIDLHRQTPNYQDALDYFVISAVEKDTPTYFYYCFSSINRCDIDLAIAFVDTKTSTETILYMNSVKNSRAISGTFSIIENNIRSYYSNNDWGGPKFKVYVKYGRNSLTKEFKAKYASTSYSYGNLDDKTVTLESDANIFVSAYNRSNGYMKESFKYAILSDEIDLTADNSLDLDFSFIKVEKHAISGVPYLISGSSMGLVDMHGHFSNDIKRQGTLYYDGEFSLNNSDQTISFRPEPTYYIDPNTRILYKENALGRILTKRLYFPLNAKRIKEASEYSNLPCYLLPTAYFGFSKTHISALMGVYISDTYLLGACYSSSYCITSTNVRSDID